MKSKTALALIALIVPIARLCAQDTASPQWLSDSSRAIQFGIGSYLSVQPFDDKSISFKTHLTATRAIRIGVSFSGSIDKGERHDRTYINGLTASSSDISYDPTHSLSVELLAQHIWYIDTGSDVFLFLGAGPLAKYSRSEYLYTGESQLTTSWSVGVGGTVGAEWFVHRRISVHSEYQAAAQYGSERSKTVHSEYNNNGVKTDNGDYRDNIWSLSGHKVLFGFSVYF